MLGRFNIKANMKYFFSVNYVPDNVPNSESYGRGETNKGA